MLVILYAVLIIGILVMFSSSIHTVFMYLYKEQYKGFRPSNTGKAYQDKKTMNGQTAFQKFLDHMEILIKTTLGEKVGAYTGTLIVGLLFLSVTGFLLVYNQQGVRLALTVAGSVVLIPYSILLLKLHSIRVESSYEGEFFVTELINQYKLNHFNMIEAIDATVVHLKDSPRTRKLLFILSMRMKSYQDVEELEKVLRDFTYGINTQWSRMVSNNLLLSIEEGFDVTSGLIDIQEELKRAKSAYEKSSRNTLEGFAIVKVLIPLLYLFTVYLSIKYFNFTVEKFIYYQVGTPGGMKLLVVNILVYSVNVMLMILFQRRRFDIT